MAADSGAWNSIYPVLLAALNDGAATMQTLRIVTNRVWLATENVPLNDGRIPNNRGVRVHLRTDYNPAEGNRRASRNGRVSDRSPPPLSLTLRFATFSPSL